MKLSLSILAAIVLAVLYVLPSTMLLSALSVGVIAVCLAVGLTLLLRERIAAASGNSGFNIDALSARAERSAPPLARQATWLNDPKLMTLTLLALIWAMARGVFVWAMSGLSRLFWPASATA